MSKYEIILRQVVSGTADKNTEFSDLYGLLRKLGFSERIKGSHHIFFHEDVVEIMNI